jgi:hypothetical protein
MKSQIYLDADTEINQAFLKRVRTWSNEVFERAEATTDIHLMIWKSNEALRYFYEREKEELSVITGEETEFLATHEAWRGYPRIHICEERLEDIPEAVVQGAVHHEIGHALLHCTPEFYTFAFSGSLQETARSFGFDLARLQQCVYFVSIAIKDREVVQWLTEIGLAASQLSLLQYLLIDVDDERRTWRAVHGFPALKKIVLAALLKVIIPIEALSSLGTKGAGSLKDQWNQAYGWLTQDERRQLFRLAQDILSIEGGTFQDRLEKTSILLIAKPLS